MANPSHDKGNAAEHADFSDETIRHRFFRDLVESERLAVFKAFGVYPPGCTDRLDHSIERQLLNRILRRSTPPSPSTAPEVPPLPDKPRSVYKHPQRGALYDSIAMDAYAIAYACKRAALASRPTEVDDEGLPPLPEGDKAYEYTGTTIVYSAEQFRQGQRDAVAADRAKVSRAMGLLREARATLETWKDMAPAVSLCADIDKVLAGGGQ